MYVYLLEYAKIMPSKNNTNSLVGGLVLFTNGGGGGIRSHSHYRSPTRRGGATVHRKVSFPARSNPSPF